MTARHSAATDSGSRAASVARRQHLGVRRPPGRGLGRADLVGIARPGRPARSHPPPASRAEVRRSAAAGPSGHPTSAGGSAGRSVLPGRPGDRPGSRRSRPGSAAWSAGRRTTAAPTPGPARPRPPSSRSSSRAATAYSRASVVREHRRVVGADRHRHPGGDQGRQRVLRQRRHRPGADVGRRTDFERDAVLGQVFHERRVVNRVDTVTDSLGAQQPHRVPDGLGPGRLTGVRHAVQPGGPGLGEVRLEPRPRYADLRAAEAEADQAVRLLAQRDVEGQVAGRARPTRRGCRSTTAWSMSCSASTVRRASSTASQNASAEMPRVHRRVRRQGQLDVPHVLARPGRRRCRA